MTTVEQAAAEKTETHPYNLTEAIPDGTRLLIVGTAPPPRFSFPRKDNSALRYCDLDFYYGSKDNYMWEFLDNIAEEIDGKRLLTYGASPEQCCDCIRAFLQRHKIWMRDVLQNYRRRKDAPSDSDIIEPDVADLTDFRPVFSHRDLNTIAFTSAKAAEWTFRALEHQNLAPREAYAKAVSEWKRIDKDLPPEEFVVVKYRQPLLRLSIDGREIKFFTLPSPTGRARKKGLTTRHKQNIYKEVLFTSV